MLEVRNLCKTYRSKDGASVAATKDISLRFPERGMVFLLGKSGSGKSTLLHLLGGLDRYDSGDILIHGTSTKDFTNAMMDSYRNTYVGFIFQDYNVLPEFNVGGNIALAMELQGVRASSERIREILEEVDLADYAKRRPNELSGGQLQRVAIARALIKDPDIILADEPTGALDSATGRQVFETLKKLSKRKLVIIVSHDREYSEQYADRIIELKDGCVISDVELKPVEELTGVEEMEFAPENGLTADKDGVTVNAEYELTEEDWEKINRFLQLRADNNVLLTEGNKVSPKRDRFRNTDEKAIVPERNEFSPIPSKLPWKRSFGIGVNSLKYKKVTLVFTILLSVAAFVLFGLADVFYSFDRLTCTVDTLWEADVDYISIVKSTENEFHEVDDLRFTEEDVRKLSSMTDRKVMPVYTYRGALLFLMQNRNGKEEISRYLYPYYTRGVAELTDDWLEGTGMKLTAGHFPTPGTAEICISTQAAEAIRLFGSDELRGLTAEQLVGKELMPVLEDDYKKVVIAGVLDVNVDFERYEKILSKPSDELTDTEWMVRRIYEKLASNEIMMGLPSVAFCAVGSLKEFQTSESGKFETQELWECRSGKYFWNNANLVRSASSLQPEQLLRFDGGSALPADNEVFIPLYDYNTYSTMYEEYGSDFDTAVKSEQKQMAWEYYKSAGLNLTVTDQSNGKTYKVVGMFDNWDERSARMSYVVSDTVFNETVEAATGAYDSLYTRMPSSKSMLRDMVEYGFNYGDKVQLLYSEGLTYAIEEVNAVDSVLVSVFYWIGLVLAVFAIVLFAVFVTNSVINKKQEIGVLRAVGARSLDVYRIFLCEVGVIALFNFLAAAVITKLIVNLINSSLQNEYLYKIVLLHFGVRQIVLLLAIAVAVSVIATFVPVWGIARRKPIDVIRDR